MSNFSKAALKSSEPVEQAGKEISAPLSRTLFHFIVVRCLLPSVPVANFWSFALDGGQSIEHPRALVIHTAPAISDKITGSIVNLQNMRLM